MLRPDASTRRADVGPQRSPLGLSADPGGFPLYKGGTVVGGVGVIADGFYTIDKDIADSDDDVDEGIALCRDLQLRGAGRPARRSHHRRRQDAALQRCRLRPAALESGPSAPAFARSRPAVGVLIAVPGYSDGTVKAGTSFGQAASGIRPDGDVDYPGSRRLRARRRRKWLRYPPRAGTRRRVARPRVLTQSEVRTILQSALDVANHARAQIRRPLGSQARVTISVVDTQGEILGVARTRDAPLFGTDVSLQKARTAAFMSSSTARPVSRGAAEREVSVDSGRDRLQCRPEIAIGDYVAALRTFLGDSIAFGDGRIAYR